MHAWAWQLMLMETPARAQANPAGAPSFKFNRTGRDLEVGQICLKCFTVKHSEASAAFNVAKGKKAPLCLILARPWLACP